mgnify:CR=1 FL=1
MSVISYSYDVVKKVKDIFSERRESAAALSESRKVEIYNKIPVIKEIDTALSMTGLALYKEAMDGRENLASAVEKLKKENKELQEARADLLVKKGYPADYTKIKYKCKKCSDTGYIGIDMCSCFAAELKKQAYLSSGLGKMLQNQSFDNFDISLYPEKDREMMKFILDETKKYAKNFGREKEGCKNLLLCGSTGLGKTHISTSVAKELIDKGFYVIYDTCQNIIACFEKERFSKEKTESTDKYFDCDLLIIDDLGTEFMSSFTHATLYNILNTRICSGKAVIISTNISDIREMKKMYDDRITSRLVGDFRTFKFSGEDIRLKNVKTRRKK